MFYIAKVLNAFAGPVTLLATERADDERARALEEAGARVVRVPAGDDGVSLPEALERLRADGVRSLMVEGGAAVLESFFKQGVVDYLALTISPESLGNPDALQLGPVAAAAIREWREEGKHQLGPDTVLVGRAGGKRVRALYFLAPRSVEVRSESMQVLGAAEVRARTEVSAISAGTELLFYRGELEAGVQVDASLPDYQASLHYPFRYGYAAVGRVEELGADVDPALLGKRVFAFQPHQDQLVGPASQFIVLPDEVSSEAGTFLANMETAISLVMDGQPMLGERVAVLGQGVVGQLTAGLLSRMGLEGVVVVDPKESRLETSRHFLGEQVAGHLHVGEAGAGSFDLVYELSGNPRALDDALTLARYEGRIVVGSWYGNRRAALDFGTRAHRNRNTLLFSQVSQLDSRHSARFDKARRMQVALSWLARLPLERLVSHRFALADIAQAYQLLDTQSQPCRQVLITY